LKEFDFALFAHKKIQSKLFIV